MKDRKQPEFANLIALLISDGVNEIEVEYDDHEWWVSAIEGNTGIGVARYSTDQEKAWVDTELERLRKEKAISVNGKTYRLSFKNKDNFGEPAWLIRVSEKK